MVLALVKSLNLRNYSFYDTVFNAYFTYHKKKQVACVLSLQLNSPLKSSEINYLFPIIFNTETKFAAQIHYQLWIIRILISRN